MNRFSLRHSLPLLAAITILALLGAVGTLVYAQTSTPTVNATVSWTAPTTDVNGEPLTGAEALTQYEVWISTTNLSSGVTGSPTATVTATSTTVTQAVTASPGQTVYTVVEACNAVGCGAPSTEASAVIPSGVPSVPTSVTITIAVTP